jgi:prolipoprotein diacylglyceryltransferase
MRRALVQWLEAHGLPGWLAPGYFLMVALASLLGAAISLRLARRDGADERLEARALLGAYLGALAGGYVIEGLRALPTALANGSVEPLTHIGRAAYGGFLGGALGAFLVLWQSRASVWPFLDRAVPLLGLCYGFVRTGCFLAGCDYGRITSGALGVRVPAGSPAALEHASLGWVPRGAPSLPVHPTQLYEAAVGIVACLIAMRFVLRGPRDGRAFATWTAVYAVGRFFVEFLRGDGSRGVYAGLGSAQWVSIVLLAVIALACLRAWRARIAAPALASLAAALLVTGSADAQPAPAPPAPAPTNAAPASPPQPPPQQPPQAQPQPPPQAQPQPQPQQQPPQQGAYPYPYPYPPPQGAQPYPYPYPYPPPQGAQPYPYPYPPPPQGAQPYPYPYPYPPPPPGAAPYPYPYPYPPPPQAKDDVTKEEEAKEKLGPDRQAIVNERRIGITAGFAGFLTPGRFAVESGPTFDLEGAARFKVGKRERFEVGLQLRFTTTPDANQYGIGVPLRFVAGLGRSVEMDVTAVPGYTHVSFASPYYGGANAFSLRASGGMAFPIGTRVTLGFTPLGLMLLGSSSVRLVIAYEPRLWLGVGFL